MSIEQVGFSLRQVLSDAVNSVSVHAREKSLRLILDVQPGLPDALLGDPLRIHQILLNLLGNAVKFTERGEVVLRAERTGETSGVGLRLSVRDTGIGI
ncbi:MAG: ATP-binding protein, partial [bacterium]